MIKREISAKLRDAAQSYPVVTITGPRQSGKTTLSRSVFQGHQYVSLEDPDIAKMAREDPRGFLNSLAPQVIIDEAQRVPDLFSYIQTRVDLEDRAGHFILTGSHNFLLMEKVAQSLAGRSAIFHLLPFSYSELAQRAPLDFDALGTHSVSVRGPHKMSLDDMLFTGLFPRIHDKHLNPQEWLQDYLHSYVERDVRLITNIGNAEAFQRFMGLCAARSGQVLNVASLAGDCDISPATAKSWLSILECSFIIRLLRPYHQNFSKRMIKSPKLYFTDTGLLCFLLKIRSPQELTTHAHRGAIFETWVVSEILKHFYNRRREPGIHFWRDSNANEIDLLIERNADVLPMAIKSGQTFNEKMFKELKLWRNLTKDENYPGALIYGGDKVMQYKGVTILPWFVL